jgi:hypothetical protein
VGAGADDPPGTRIRGALVTPDRVRPLAWARSAYRLPAPQRHDQKLPSYTPSMASTATDPKTFLARSRA